MTDRADTGEAPEEQGAKVSISDELYCMRKYASAMVRVSNGFPEHPLLGKTHEQHMASEFMEDMGYGSGPQAKGWSDLRSEWEADARASPPPSHGGRG